MVQTFLRLHYECRDFNRSVLYTGSRLQALNIGLGIAVVVFKHLQDEAALLLGRGLSTLPHQCLIQCQAQPDIGSTRQRKLVRKLPRCNCRSRLLHSKQHMPVEPLSIFLLMSKVTGFAEEVNESHR